MLYFEEKIVRKKFKEFGSNRKILNSKLEDLQSSFDSFICNDSYTGDEADAAKAFVKIVEKKIAGDIWEALKELKDMENDLMSDYSSTVDSSKNSIIYNDKLGLVVQDFQDFATDFKTYRTSVDDIYNELVSSCSGVGSYTKPNSLPITLSLNAPGNAVVPMFGDFTQGSVKNIAKTTKSKLTSFNEKHSGDIASSNFQILCDSIEENINQCDGNLTRLSYDTKTSDYKRMGNSSFLESSLDFSDRFWNIFLKMHTFGLIGTDTIGGLILDMFEDKDGVYHTRTSAWQQIGGYNDLYDTLFDLGTDMDKERFEFTDKDGRKYILWAWKGDYINLGAGAELGIYSNESGIKGEKDIKCPFSEHWLVDTSLALPMTMTVKDSKGDEVAIYTPEEKQWWITSFNPEYKDIPADELNVTFTVDFSDNKEMYEAFITSKDYLEKKKYWSSEDPNNKYLLTFTWNK